MDEVKINNNIINLFKKLFLNKSLAEKFSKCKTFDEFYDFCQSVENGYTKEELIDFMDYMGELDWDPIFKQNLTKKLGNEDLEYISGGLDHRKIEKVVSSFLSLLTLGVGSVFIGPNVKATNYGSSISSVSKFLKSGFEKTPDLFKIAWLAAGCYLVGSTVSNFSQRNISPSIGLSNPGNSCYINAALQQLYSISEFRNKVMRDNSENPKIKALKIIFKSLDEGRPLDRETRDNVLVNLGYEGTQESSYDFLSQTKYIRDVFEKFGLDKIYSSTPFNPVGDNTIEGHLKSDSCFQKSFKNQKQIILPFAQRPCDAGKSDFIAPQVLKSSGKEKHLTGVIVKSGGAGGGHYVSYKKTADGSWFLYNDSLVTRVSEKEVQKEISKNCTILVYSS